MAAKLITLYPLPNLPGAVNNYFNNPEERVNADNYNGRIDHRITDRDLLFGRYSQKNGHNEKDRLLTCAAQ